jgi:hypothetical protein
MFSDHKTDQILSNNSRILTSLVTIGIYPHEGDYLSENGNYSTDQGIPYPLKYLKNSVMFIISQNWTLSSARRIHYPILLTHLNLGLPDVFQA